MVSEDIPDKFWKEYYEMSILERQDKCNVFAKCLIDICSVQDKEFREKHLKFGVTQHLMGLFDDLINYMEDKDEKD